MPFDTDRTELPDAARAALDGVVAALDGNPRARATVRAYADGGGDANQARRTSLSRALSVRAYLIDRGVASARIDVRALGNQAGEGRKDRVDIVTSDR
ncbi:OmpA family protein [Roseospira marina]|uniref:OmpA family protein n=1 Tax=Roseospira marina TaxID=140057 RepID=UPI00147884B0|nr:OmpA family protein [Roseospira marina]MBB4312577.1 outer membrane protein OmpA-like peptidoglycan-associated protein [Roseospira marina]MBB5085407.1 outer membrane protein OmpA-like peptidoglycan-associated protein [Roseospira marina]